MEAEVRAKTTHAQIQPKEEPKPLKLEIPEPQPQDDLSPRQMLEVQVPEPIIPFLPLRGSPPTLGSQYGLQSPTLSDTSMTPVGNQDPIGVINTTMNLASPPLNPYSPSPAGQLSHILPGVGSLPPPPVAVLGGGCGNIMGAQTPWTNMSLSTVGSSSAFHTNKHTESALAVGTQNVAMNPTCTVPLQFSTVSAPNVQIATSTIFPGPASQPQVLPQQQVPQPQLLMSQSSQAQTFGTPLESQPQLTQRLSLSPTLVLNGMTCSDVDSLVDPLMCKCDHCGDSFASPETYGKHMQYYECVTCSVAFLGFCKLKQHQQEEGHSFPRPAIYFVDEVTPPPPPPSQQRVYQVQCAIVKKRRRGREKKGTLECKYCRKRLPTQHQLQIHVDSHNGLKPYQCKYCDARFARKDKMRIHEIRGTGHRFGCKLCSKRYMFPTQLTLHVRKVHRSASFEAASYLPEPSVRDSPPPPPPPVNTSPNLHLKTQAEIVLSTSFPPSSDLNPTLPLFNSTFLTLSQPNPGNGIGHGTTGVSPPIPNFIDTSSAASTLHINTPTVSLVSVPNHSISLATIPPPAAGGTGVNTTSSQKFPLHHLPLPLPSTISLSLQGNAQLQQFSSALPALTLPGTLPMGNLTTAFDSHTKPRKRRKDGYYSPPLLRFQCQYCPKCFVNESELNRHTRKHTGEKPYHCTDCPKKFAQQGNLLRHMTTHTGERPHKCPECNQAFTDPSSLTRHKRIHSDFKPYVCDSCNAPFRNISNLKAHRVVHHNLPTPHQCPECYVYRVTPSQLLKHMKSHEKKAK